MTYPQQDRSNFSKFTFGFLLAIGSNLYVNEALALRNETGEKLVSNIERLPVYLMFTAGAFFYWLKNRNAEDPSTRSASQAALGYAIGGTAMSFFRIAQTLTGTDSSTTSNQLFIR